MFYALIVLALTNSLTGCLLYDRINSFANYRASVEAQAKILAEENQREIAAHEKRTKELSFALTNEAIKHAQELNTLKNESDNALNDAVKRLRTRASRCENGMSSTITSSKTDKPNSGGARGVAKGVDELLEVNRLIEKYERINVDFKLCLKGYDVH